MFGGYITGSKLVQRFQRSFEYSLNTQESDECRQLADESRDALFVIEKLFDESAGSAADRYYF